MTQQNNEAFEKFMHSEGYAGLYIGDGQYKFSAMQLTWEVWQAAKADSESNLKGQQNTIAELKARINVLREALSAIRVWCEQPDTDLEDSIGKLACEALALTLAQHINDDMRIFSKYSLQAHDDEVIERCAVAMENYHVLEGIPAMYIRALKGNQFPNSANLDMYNSVIFSDGSHGTMIMESKIVKWLCKNRAKDYFDEMVEGK
jgi:hypothetical protein